MEKLEITKEDRKRFGRREDLFDFIFPLIFLFFVDPLIILFCSKFFGGWGAFIGFLLMCKVTIFIFDLFTKRSDEEILKLKRWSMGIIV